MKLIFVGADHEVTGSCHYINVCGKNILVDYGMRQGAQTYENIELPVAEAAIDYVLLTHAHVDHSGMLPRLYSRGFRGQIIATEATVDLCSIMLRDCAHIQLQEAEWKKRKGQRNSDIKVTEPEYTMEDAQGTINLLVPVSYGQMVDLCDGVKVRFTDIGHLLGSASIEVWMEEDGNSKKIVFSGDIGNYNQPLIKNPGRTLEADYVVMESTYGDRLHSTDRPDYVAELTKIIKETFDRGGNVVIPSFAVGRTQEMLYFIRQIKSEKRIPEYQDFPVYVDSPLAVEATEIFNENKETCFDEAAMELVNKGINPIRFPGLRLAITSDESREINFENTPKVIISASGMCEAGRIRHHLKHNLWRPDSTILFVGYQAYGTLGRAIIEGAETVKLFGETVDVKAKIMTLAGMSGHADKQGLIDWITAFEEKPRKVFVVHGEDKVADEFTECLNHEYKIHAYAPYSGTEFDMATGKLSYEAEPVKAVKKVFTVSNVYNRLVAAGKRLMAVIEKNKGLANKDLGKFADQVNSLCDKWDR